VADQISPKYTGADLIADFIAQNCFDKVFLVTGGACAFIVDALGRSTKSSYVCFQHEQAAAMAADAIWRTTQKVGVTLSTSGPGATNLITGIACSWFDSIPSLHITGQVNQSESREVLNAKVRQAGFQETDIAEIVKSITKFSKRIESISDLIETLPKALEIALEHRMGPVLLDVPMNIQKAEVTTEERSLALRPITPKSFDFKLDSTLISDFLSKSKRPLALIGAGAGLSGTAKLIQSWCERNSIPYVTSWGALTHIDRDLPGYFGSIGVYGSRKGNWAIQAADRIVTFGSRLDNRQRTGNPDGFSPFAKLMTIDIDEEELKKYIKLDNYQTVKMDLAEVSSYLIDLQKQTEFITEIKNVTDGMDEGFQNSVGINEFNPYFAVRTIQEKFDDNSIVVSDCGANLCWVYQSFLPSNSFLFTAGGNSPMGYSLPAAIGAQLANPDKKVYCFIGDGGLQMNIQELQPLVEYNLPITIFIQNNLGYGIIKQFQDAYFDGRHFASGEGYSIPNFSKIASAYGISYQKITSQKELAELKLSKGTTVVDLIFPENSLITPKVEMNRFIHDQFPYIDDKSIERLPYNYPARPSNLEKTIPVPGQ
jgi:acetolactate synthase-1/2/3 large subunit